MKPGRDARPAHCIAAGRRSAAAAGTSGPTPPPRLDAWRVIGPGGGGTTRRPAISPHDPKVVVLGCDMTGAYLTSTAARPGGCSTSARCRRPSPSIRRDPPTLYAGAEAVYRSDDAGRTWRMVLPDPAKNTVARAIGDHGDRVSSPTTPPIPAAAADVTVHAIAVDEDDPSRVYVAAERGRLADARARPPRRRCSSARPTAGARGRGSRTSPRSGSSRCAPTAARRAARARDRRDRRLRRRGDRAWQHLRRARRGALHLRQLRPRPALGPRVRVRDRCRWPVRGPRRSPGGVQASDDGGRTWHARQRRAARRRPRRRRARRGVGTGEGLAAVARADRGLRALPARGVRRPARPRCFPAAARRPSTASRRRPTAGRPGASCTPSRTGRRRTSPRSWIEPRAPEDGHSVWFDSPYDLAVAPNDPDVAYATDLFRAYRTTDGGRHVGAGQLGAPRRRPLDDARPRRHDDVRHPVRPPRPEARLHPVHRHRPVPQRGRRRDLDGLHRAASRTRWRNTTYWLAFDPEVKDLVWGGFSGTHDLPRPKMWRRTDPARFQGGVGVSTDGGAHWTPSNQGMEESAITHVARSTRGARRAAARSTRPRSAAGVYKSVDNGRTWALKNARPRRRPAEPAVRLAAHARAGDGTLYLVVARRSERGRIGDADDGALYRSTDGAEHWQPVPLPAGTNGPNGLTVDPADPTRLYLVGLGRHPPRRRHRAAGSSSARDAGATLASRPRRGAARLRRDRRPARSQGRSTPAASTRPRSARPTAERPGPASAASTSSGASA